MSTIDFAQLPKYVAMEIFGHLSARDAAISRRVCRQFRDLIQDPAFSSFWKQKYRDKWGWSSSFPPNTCWIKVYCENELASKDQREMYDSFLKDPTIACDLVSSLIKGIFLSYNQVMRVLKVASVEADPSDPNMQYSIAYLAKEYGYNVNNVYIEHYHLALAAFLGSPGALRKLGHLTINKTRRLDYLNRAAGLGSAGALYDLREYHWKNSEKAIEYAKLAAMGGFHYAIYRLGMLYEKGIGTAVNFQMAFYYYKLAADKGVERAYFKVGLFYCLGIAVEKNYDKGLLYLKESRSILAQKWIKDPSFAKYTNIELLRKYRLSLYNLTKDVWHDATI